MKKAMLIILQLKVLMKLKFKCEKIYFAQL